MVAQVREWNAELRHAGRDLRKKEDLFFAMSKNINRIIDDNILGLAAVVDADRAKRLDDLGTRLLLCYHAAVLLVKTWDWLVTDGFGTLRDDKIINDYSDTDYLYNALLFHGLLTEEKRSLRVMKICKELVSTLDIGPA